MREGLGTSTMNSGNRFRNAAVKLRHVELEKYTAWSLSHLLVSCKPSALPIFQCISELTRAEALEVLSCLCLQGDGAVPAAIRICASLDDRISAWETLSALMPLEWKLRDLSLLAITFGRRARFSRDWSSCVRKAFDDCAEAKLVMAALLETREVNVSKCLVLEDEPVECWSAQGKYETEPSLGRELAWCFFASQCQMATEARSICECEEAVSANGTSPGISWLQVAEPGNNVLNEHYFRMFGVLMRKRSRTSYQKEVVVSNDSEFAYTRSVRKVFHQFAHLASSLQPVLIEGPHGCGKSSVLYRLAHVMNTGTTSVCTQNANVCFIHMDSAANKEDSNDIFSLVGGVVPLPSGGGFRWRLGPIGHAIVRGQWLVLENMECDHRTGNSYTGALVSKLAGLRPGDVFPIPFRSEPLRVGLGFRLFSTRSIRSSDQSKGLIWTPPGGCDVWSRISMPSLSPDEETSVLSTRFPTLLDCIPRVLIAVSEVRARILHGGRAFDREPSLRVSVRICERLSLARRQNPDSFSFEHALQETLDCLAAWAMEDGLRKNIVSICCQAWSLPVLVGEAAMSENFATVLDLGDCVQIGRSRIAKNSRSIPEAATSRLALTKHTSRLLERISRCINVGESVLLNGESGTGKTAVLQELARLSNRELVVINMSRQSDISDLLGGFRPFELSAALPVLVKQFEESFRLHCPTKKNEKFYDALHRAARSRKRSGDALRLMRGGMKFISSSVRNSSAETALAWTRIERMIVKLESLVPKSDSTSDRADEPVTNRKEGSPPPRKRHRSSTDDGKGSPLEPSSVKETVMTKRDINFEYADGVLVSALRSGHWVLLDEINLAPVEVLDQLVSLLDHGCLSIANEESEIVRGKSGFALFAAMNPPTDVGKRPLAKEIRSRMTEFFIEDIENIDDIALLVSYRLFGVNKSDRNSRRLSAAEEGLSQDIAKFFLEARALSQGGALDDARGRCPRFSLRTLSIMLSHTVNLSKFTASSRHGRRRASFEGAVLAFSTPLPRNARRVVEKLASNHLLHQTDWEQQPELSKIMVLPNNSSVVNVAGFPIETRKAQRSNEKLRTNFVVTAAVTVTLTDVCRALTYGGTRIPILLQGPTSAGKTSLVTYLASLTNNELIRINNHEHTDIGEYLGSYIANDQGSLVFQEGPLVRAVREGHWVVLDELNLAPPEVLESLNRLLDDNREVRIPETGEVVKAHKNFTLFATQNPPGLYGGRKELSRAFRGRFVEIQVDELPEIDLIEIIERRCRLPKSFALKMVGVMRELQTRRRASRLFSGKGGFVTARDLFRWGARGPQSKEELAIHGFFLLGERARNLAERDIVRDVLLLKIGVKDSVLSDSILYGGLLKHNSPLNLSLPRCPDGKSGDIKERLSKIMSDLQIANTPHMARMASLILYCASYNEPALLVGPTGSGKTSACSLIAALMQTELLSVNCHRHTESSDLVGGFRPGRQTGRNAALFEWTDGPLVKAMKDGNAFLMDEINMADDAVVERLNAVLEPSRSLMLPEKGSKDNIVIGHPSFRIFATMNPGGDFGKKELSPALRNRFTEIWIPFARTLEDFFPVIQSRICFGDNEITNTQLKCAQRAMQNFLRRTSSLTRGESAWANEDSFQKKKMLSLRDISTWSNFIQKATVKCGMHPMVAFAHGARLVFIDGISVGSNTSTERDVESNLWTSVLDEIPSHLISDARKASFESGELEIRRCDSGVFFGPFLLRRTDGLKLGPSSADTFCMNAPCTLRNSSRVVRAISVDNRPILLEGPPGAGKTSLVTALARAAGISLSRINLSESTEMSDLIGGDIPGASPGQFCFRKGELLRSIECGFWILLDEMNLASQSVLEGLNSLLDHRRSVFIPELASEVVAHPNFRLFAAQNPAREGCGRRGLPQSFLNRFTKVAVEAPSQSDLIVIACTSFPNLEISDVKNVVRTLTLLKNHFENHSSADSSPEYGLRQVLKWCNLLSVSDKELAPEPELCFDVIVLQGLRNEADLIAAAQIFRSVFQKKNDSLPTSASIRIVDNANVRFGPTIVHRGHHLEYASIDGFRPTMKTSHTRQLSALAMISRAGWPCIISGESGGKCNADVVQTVKMFAGLSGQKVLKMKGGSFLDADDLLGGYMQADLEEELLNFRQKILSTYEEALLSLLSFAVPHGIRSSIEELEMTLAKIARSSVAFNPSGHDKEFVNAFFEAILQSVSMLSSFNLSDVVKKQLHTLSVDISKFQEQQLRSSNVTPSSFRWVRSELVRAVEDGHWVIIEDADHCPPSVLDRLNPLLEFSIRSHTHGSFSKSRDAVHPVLLPEAPPNVDGSPAMIFPHPNFRLFLVVDDANGQKISRAIVDRSIKVKLCTDLSPADELTDLLSGSQQLDGACVKCRGNISAERALMHPLSARTVGFCISDNIFREASSRRLLNTLCTGTSAFSLNFEESLRIRDSFLLSLVKQSQSWTVSMPLEDLQIFPSPMFATPAKVFDHALKGSKDLSFYQQHVSFFLRSYMKCLVKFFLLGCSSAPDFRQRLHLSRSVAFMKFDTLMPQEPSQDNTDMFIDPVYGLDIFWSSRVHHPDVLKSHITRAIRFRFDVLALSDLFSLWDEANEEARTISFKRGSIPLFCISKKQFDLSMDEVAPSDPVLLLGHVAYKIIFLLVKMGAAFRKAILSNMDALQGWVLPEETTWLHLFDLAFLFLGFLRMPCKSAEDCSRGMVLLRQIETSGSRLCSLPFTISDSEISSKLSEILSLCGLRAKYEMLAPALPIPRSERGARLERDIFSLCHGQRRTNSRAIVQALVKLSTGIAEQNQKTLLDVEKLKSALEHDANHNTLPSSSEESMIFPLWEEMVSSALDGFILSLLVVLQKCEPQNSVKILSTLRSETNDSLLEVSLNPSAPLLAQVPLQRMYWISSAGTCSTVPITEIIHELSLSALKICIRKSREELLSWSAERMYCLTLDTGTLSNGLLSLSNHEMRSVQSPAPILRGEAVSVACGLLAGGLSPPYRTLSKFELQLQLLLSTLRSLGLISSGFQEMNDGTMTVNSVLQTLALFSAVCTEVLNSSSLQALPNFIQVQSVIRSALNSLGENSTQMSTPHSLCAVVRGLLWVVAGAVRVQNALNSIKRLYGVEPSCFAKAEFNFCISQHQHGAAMEAACSAASFLKVGSDNLETCAPFSRARQKTEVALEEALQQKSRVVHRPKEFASFSMFENSVIKIQELLSQKSLVWQLFIMSFQGSLAATALDFVKGQLQDSILTLLETSCDSLEIGGQFGHFRDVGGNVSHGLREVQLGSLVSLKGLRISSLEENKQVEVLSKSYQSLLSFPRAVASKNVSSLEIVNCLVASKISVLVQAQAIGFLYLHSCEDKLTSLPAVRKGFSSIVSTWKSAQLKEESDEKARSSLFIIKESSKTENFPGFSELHRLENEEEDFVENFNTGFAEVEMILGETNPSATAPQSAQADEAEITPSGSSAILDPSEFWRLHSSCFLFPSTEANPLDSVKQTAFLNLLSALGGIAESSVFAQSNSETSVAALTACLASNRLSGSCEFIIPVASKTYNFYKDSNVSEVSKMRTALGKLNSRICDVQQELMNADGKHPVLSVVSDTIERTLKAATVTSCLGPLVSGVESILRKVDEWQRLFATNVLSLEKESKEVSIIARRWRGIEVASWPNLLRSRDELSKHRAYMWIYFLYDGLIGDNDHPYEGDENLSTAVSAMDQFLRSSPQGEYATRILMLLSLSNQLRLSDIVGHQNLGFKISGLCRYYQQFLPRVEAAIATAKQPLEKKMNEFSRLSTWRGERSLGGITKMAKGADKELEYVRLKERSEKVRRKLHKLCRDADSVLRIPVFTEISKQTQTNGFLELSSAVSPRSDSRVRVAERAYTSLICEEFDNLRSETLFHFGNVSMFDASPRLSNIKSLCNRMREIGAICVDPASFTPKQAEETCIFMQNSIRTRALDLKRSSQAGIQLKKRAFVELLRALELSGVTPYEQPDIKKRCLPVFWLGVDSPFRAEALKQRSDALFFEAASRVQRLRAVSDARVRNVDITADESKKCVSFVFDLFDRAILQRISLSSAISDLISIHELASQMSDFSFENSGEEMPSLSSAKHLFDVAKRMESIQKDVFFALMLGRKELSNAEHLSKNNLSNEIHDKYVVLSLRRNITSARACIQSLERTSDLLRDFSSSKPAVTLLNLSRRTAHLVTKELSTCCTQFVGLFGTLSVALKHELLLSETESKSSLSSSTLRSIVLYTQNALNICISSSREKDNTGISSSMMKVSKIKKDILQDCEDLIEASMVAAQTLFRNENSSNSVKSEIDKSIPANILKKGHLMTVNSISLSPVLTCLRPILEQLNMLENSRGKEMPVDTLSSVQLAVQNAGKFILSFLTAFAVPYFSAISHFHMESLGLVKTITALFIGISEEGFCRPPEMEEAGNDDSLPSDVDGTGFGDVGEGDASLAKDVTAEIEDEEQLLGMRDDSNPALDEGNDQNDMDVNSGVEMSHDFDGQLQDIEQPEEKESKEDDKDEDGANNIEEQFGEEPDSKAEDVDERLWNDQDEINPSAKEENGDHPDIESGKHEQDVTLAARENSETHLPQPQSSKEIENYPGTSDEKHGSDEEECERDQTNENGEGQDSAEQDIGADEDESEHAKRGQPKMGNLDEKGDVDNADESMEEITHELEDKDKEDSKDPCSAEEGLRHENDTGLSASDEEGHVGGQDEEMVGFENNPEAPQDGEQDEGNTGSCPVSEDTMDNLQDVSLSGDENCSDIDAANELNEQPTGGSDVNMNDLPEEQNGGDQIGPLEDSSVGDPPNNEKDRQEHDVRNQPNPESSHHLTGGKRTTPSSRKEKAVDESPMFSNPDASGSSVSKTYQDVTMDQVHTSEGPEIGESPSATAKGEALGRSNDPAPKLEDFEPYSALHEPNPFRGDETDEPSNDHETQVNVVGDSGAPDESRNDTMNGLHEFVPEAEKKSLHEKSAMGPATDDQHKPLGKQKEDDKELEDLNIDDDVVHSVKGNDSLPRKHEHEQLHQNDVSEHREKEHEDSKMPHDHNINIAGTNSLESLAVHPVAAAINLLETLCIDENKVPAEESFSAPDGNPVSVFNVLEEMDETEGDATVHKHPVDTSAGTRFEKPNFPAMWRQLERLVEGDAAALCEQLRMILEPTDRSGLAGAFKTGKRLDMKKVIDFVASDFRRDRIWLRRVRPSKRAYDVLVAIDDSESMSESGAGALALAGLVLVNSALSKLEVGRVGILKFGANCHIVRELNESIPIDEAKGGSILSQFSFSEKHTNLGQLLSTSYNILRYSRGSASEGEVQLLFIISDGKLSEREELRKQLRFISSENVVVAFIVVDSNSTGKSNIFNVKHVSYDENGRMKLVPYMNDFPFQFYTVVHDVKLLPSVLGNALRQWFELMTNLS